MWQDSDINIGDALSLCRVDLLAIGHYNYIIAPLALGSRSNQILLSATIHTLRTRINKSRTRFSVLCTVEYGSFTTLAKLRISLVEGKSNVSSRLVLFPRTRIVYTCGYHSVIHRNNHSLSADFRLSIAAGSQN